MFSQNELSNAANFAWLGTAFLTWVAVIWLYYKGEWRQSTHKGIRESSAMFLRGACLSMFAQWVHRAYWAGYLVLLEAGQYASLADVTAGRWVVPIIAMLGAIGNVMMLYPILKFFVGANWVLVGALIIIMFWSTGLYLT